MRMTKVTNSNLGFRICFEIRYSYFEFLERNWNDYKWVPTGNRQCIGWTCGIDQGMGLRDGRVVEKLGVKGELELVVFGVNGFISEVIGKMRMEIRAKELDLPVPLLVTRNAPGIPGFQQA